MFLCNPSKLSERQEEPARKCPSKACQCNSAVCACCCTDYSLVHREPAGTFPGCRWKRQGVRLTRNVFGRALTSTPPPLFCVLPLQRQTAGSRDWILRHPLHLARKASSWSQLHAAIFMGWMCLGLLGYSLGGISRDCQYQAGLSTDFGMWKCETFQVYFP